MKYRILSDEELKNLEEDFKKFLVASDISSEEWIKINSDSPEKAKEFVELFSDLVLQKVYESVQFIEHRSKTDLKVFKFEKDNIELVALKAKSDKVDFSTLESINDSLKHRSSQIEIFRGSKKYDGERELELFDMFKKGCVVSTEDFWNLLEKLIV